jgi:nucleotide-binding universal stress UspA family protein
MAADPDDIEAREAVVAALGPRACVVKGSARAIDAQLSEIWGNNGHSRLKFNVCAMSESLPGELWDYAQALGVSLGARLGWISTAGEADALARERRRAQFDLAILGNQSQPLLRALLSRPVANEGLPRRQRAVPFGVLVAQRPRWPLERLLLVLCGDSADNGAVDWALRLARPAGAIVTAVAVVPPVPAMYRGLSRMELGVAELLATDTPLGRQLHQVARRLAESDIDSKLRLRQGSPDRQICREVVEGNHDLIVMATRPCRWWLRQLKGDPICSLLSWVDRPTLLVEPTIE